MANASCGTLAKPAKRKKAARMKDCDTVWRKIILALFDCRCAVCGKGDGQVHVHHLISRASHFFRHNVNNGIALCPRCHTFNPQLSAHAAPWAFDVWMQDHRPEQYAWWAKNRNTAIKTTIDWGKVLDTLKEELARLEAHNDPRRTGRYRGPVVHGGTGRP